ncbi:Ankyrin repeat domain-containing protein 66 [Bulinus truncatus]|nr:Ankyrin repeat domain-containing protein 66 [Bulinus truncatus]
MAPGFAECVRLLLDNGASGKARTETGWTPAHFAAESGRITVLRALHTANVRVDRKDNYGCTPRRLAEIYNHQDCVKFLQQAEQEIAERCRALGLLNSSDEEDEVETVTSVAFAVEEKSSDDTIRSSSRQRRRKDAVVSPTQSEGRKSRGSDISALSSEKVKSKNKINSLPKGRKKSKNSEDSDKDVISSSVDDNKKDKKSKERKSFSAQSEGKNKKDVSSKADKKKNKELGPVTTNNKQLFVTEDEQVALRVSHEENNMNKGEIIDTNTQKKKTKGKKELND